ncbi:MAG: GAF domain-containing protein [bacterium]|nr:GAF domain-containing protein [bacterium]
MQTSRRLPFGLGLRYPYKDYFLRQRAIGVLYLMLVTGILMVPLFLNNVLNSILNRTNLQIRDFIPLVALSLAFFVTYLVQNGRVNWAARMIVITSFVLLLFLQQTSSTLTWSTVNVLVLISAGLLLNRLWLIATSATLIFNLARFAISNNLTFADALSQGYGTTLLLTLLITLYFFLFSNLLEESVRREIDGGEQMSAVGNFLRRIPRRDEDETFVSVINFIRNDLRYNFAQVFLVDDDNGLLTTRIRTGLGVSIEALRTPIRVSDTSALTQALRTKTAIFVNSSESEFRHEHFLPSSKFGVAVPIMVRDDVIAILDVQDTTGRFSRMRMRALELLAEGLSIILEDVATVNALRQVLNDQSSTLDNLRRQLREYKQYEKQVVGGVWDEYLQGRGYEAIGFDLDMTQVGNPTLTPSFDLPDELAPTLETKEVHVELSADGNRVLVPIILRGEVLGAVRFILPTDKPPSERQLDLIQNVVDRLALALENKRLFEQSRSQAIRERKANEVARELIGATEVRDVLNLAAQMFTNALGAIHTHIQLQPDVMKLQPTLTSEVPSISSDIKPLGEKPDA